MKTEKLECEVKSHVFCNGIAVRKMKGTKKDDPVFNACWGCQLWMRRNGIKFKEVALCPPKKSGS